MAKKVSRTTTTTMRLSKDLLKAMDKETKRLGLTSRTQLFEQTMRRSLNLPAIEMAEPAPPSVFS
jgi:metal-responsive CopG/Arc/MetJ family transcriptional regulator